MFWKKKKPKHTLLDCYPSKPFVVKNYLDRMIELSNTLQKEKEGFINEYELILWWGNDGLRISKGGASEWIKAKQDFSEGKIHTLSQTFARCMMICCTQPLQSLSVGAQSISDTLMRSSIQSLQAQNNALRYQAAMMSECQNALITSSYMPSYMQAITQTTQHGFNGIENCRNPYR